MFFCENEFYLHENKKKKNKIKNKIIIIIIILIKPFQINNFALNLALKQRLVATRKWPFKPTNDIIARIML